MSRLNRKRKASCEREADKARCKKDCLKRSVAKALLTLDRQTGKSTEEYAVATTLLNLSVEPVMSSGEHDVLQDQLEVGEPENRTVESTEPIESRSSLESRVSSLESRSSHFRIRDKRKINQRLWHTSKLNTREKKLIIDNFSYLVCTTLMKSIQIRLQVVTSC